MRVLVTGGAGFLGSHICDRLIAEGHTVICLDSLLTGREKNIAHLLDHPRFIFFRYDITQPFYIAEKVDWVLHFASPASPKDYAANPIHTLKVGGLGTYHMLGLAKAHKAKFLLASTSEVYGDPEVHPQPESYWGNVNPIGPRSCYDEAKRFAEALTMAYWRQHGVDVRIVRIFNSILADERVVVFNDERIHLEPVAEYFSNAVTKLNGQIFIPAFDPQTGKIELRTVSALIRHPCVTDAYCLRLSYGRRLKVTGDHSVFTRGEDGKPVPVPVRKLRVGDYVAIPAKLPVIERDLSEIRLSDELLRCLPEPEWWRYRVVSPQIPLLIDRHRRALRQLLQEAGRTHAKKFWGANNILTACKRARSLPLFVFAKLNLSIPEDALIRAQSSHQPIPNRIPVTDELLWLCGLILAEGHVHANEAKGRYFISVSSDLHLLERAAEIMKRTFGVRVKWEQPKTNHRAPSIRVDNKLLAFLFNEVLGLGGKATERRIPSWVFQLPLPRLKWFLEGYKDGDGAQSVKSAGKELCFNTSSPRLADDLALLLLRFGLVASLGEYTTTFKQRYGNRRFKSYRLTLRGLSTFDILSWDKGVTQKLLYRRWGDLVWARVRAIEPTVLTLEVYDFSVPGCENFIAGNGVCAHNTVGPRMRLDDGRVFPNFICQALKGEPITVYGDGSQTRSFCYVDDLIEGVMKVMEWTPPNDADELSRVFNLGNPEEITVIEFAHLVKEITKSRSPIVFCPLPKDDPKQRRPDITKAKTVLGWSPKVSLREAIERTLPYFKQELGLA